MKKFVAAFLSVLMSFSAVSALPETNASSAQNVSYKIVDGKDAVLMKREELRLFLFLYLSFHLYFTDEPFLCRHGGLPEKIIDVIYFYDMVFY